MIEKIEVYRIKCDRCGKEYQSPFYGKSIFYDEEEAIEEFDDDDDSESGWLEKGGKHTCPECLQEIEDMKYF